MAPEAKSCPQQHHCRPPIQKCLLYAGLLSNVRGSSADEEEEGRYILECKSSCIASASQEQELSSRERPITTSHRFAPRRAPSAASFAVEDSRIRSASVSELMRDQGTAAPADPAADPLLEPSSELSSGGVAPSLRYVSKSRELYSGAGDGESSLATTALQEVLSPSPVQVSPSASTGPPLVELNQGFSATSAVGISENVTTNPFPPPPCTSTSSSWSNTAASAYPAAPALPASLSSSGETTSLPPVAPAGGEYAPHFTERKNRGVFCPALETFFQHRLSKGAALPQVFSAAFFKEVLERIAQSQSDNIRVHALLELEMHAHSLRQDTACLHATLTVLDAVLCNAVSTLSITAFPDLAAEEDPPRFLTQQQPERVAARSVFPACTPTGMRSAAGTTQNTNLSEKADFPTPAQPTFSLKDAASVAQPSVPSLYSQQSAGAAAAQGQKNAPALSPFLSFQGPETSNESFMSVSSEARPPSSVFPDTASSRRRKPSSSTSPHAGRIEKALACELNMPPREFSPTEESMPRWKETTFKTVDQSSSATNSPVENRGSHAGTSSEKICALKTQLLLEAPSLSGFSQGRPEITGDFRTDAAAATSPRAVHVDSQQQSERGGEQRKDEGLDIFLEPSPARSIPYTPTGMEKRANEGRQKHRKSWHGREGLCFPDQSTPAAAGASDTRSARSTGDLSYAMKLASPFSPLARLVCMRVYTSLCVTLDLLLIAPEWVERFAAVLFLLITHVETENSDLFRRYACGCLEELERNWPGMLIPFLGTGCGLSPLKNRVPSAPAQLARPAEEAASTGLCSPFRSSLTATSASSGASALPSSSCGFPSSHGVSSCQHSSVTFSPQSPGISTSLHAYRASPLYTCTRPSPPLFSFSKAAAFSTSVSAFSSPPLPSSLASAPAFPLPFPSSSASCSSRGRSGSSRHPTSSASPDTSSGRPSGHPAPLQLSSAPSRLPAVSPRHPPRAVSTGLLLLQKEQQPLVADGLVNLLLLTARQGVQVLSAAARQPLDGSERQFCFPPPTVSHAPIPNYHQQEQSPSGYAEQKRTVSEGGMQGRTAATSVHTGGVYVKAAVPTVRVPAGAAPAESAPAAAAPAAAAPAAAAADTRQELESNCWNSSADPLLPFDPLTTFPVSPLPLAAVYSCSEASCMSLPASFTDALQQLLSEILRRFWRLGEWTQAHVVHTLAFCFRLLDLCSTCKNLEPLVSLLYSERPPLLHALLRLAAAAATTEVLDAAAAQLVRQKLQGICVNRVLKEHFRLLAMRWLGALLKIRLFACLFFETPPCYLCPSPCDSSIAQEHLLQLLLLFYRRRREFFAHLQLSAAGSASRELSAAAPPHLACKSGIKTPSGTSTESGACIAEQLAPCGVVVVVASQLAWETSKTRQNQQRVLRKQQQQQQLEKRLKLQLSALQGAACLPSNVVEVCEALQGCWCGPQPIGVHAVLYRFLLRLLRFPCQGLRKHVHAFLCEQLRLSPFELTSSTLAVLHHLSDCEEPSATPGEEPPCAACREWSQPLESKWVSVEAQNISEKIDVAAHAGGRPAAASSTVSSAIPATPTPLRAVHDSELHCPVVASSTAAGRAAALAASPYLVATPAFPLYPPPPQRHELSLHSSRPLDLRFRLADAAAASFCLPLRAQSVATHSLLLSLSEVVKKLEPPSRISAFFPLLLRLSEEPAVPPAVVLHALQRLADAVLSSSSALEAQQQWETGMQILTICRQLLTNYSQRALLQPMSELLLRLADATVNLDVRDNALLLLNVLLHAGSVRLRALLCPVSPHLPVALAQQHLTCVSPYTYQFVGGVPFLEFRKSLRERLQLCGLRDGQAAFFLFCAGCVWSPVERQEGRKHRQRCTCHNGRDDMLAARHHQKRNSRQRKHQKRGQQHRVHLRACLCEMHQQQQTRIPEPSQAPTDGSVVGAGDSCQCPKCHADERSFFRFLQQIYRLHFESDMQTVVLLSEGGGRTGKDTLTSAAHQQECSSLDAFVSASRRRSSAISRTVPQWASHQNICEPCCSCCCSSCSGGWGCGSLSDDAAVAQYRLFVASTPFFVRMPFCLQFRPNFQWQMLQSPPFPLPLAATAVPAWPGAAAGHAPAAPDRAKHDGHLLRTRSAAGQHEGSGGGVSGRNDGGKGKVLTELYGVELTFSQPEHYALLRSVHLPLLQNRDALVRPSQKIKCASTNSTGMRKEGELQKQHHQHTQKQQEEDQVDATASFFPFMYKLVLKLQPLSPVPAAIPVSVRFSDETGALYSGVLETFSVSFQDLFLPVCAPSAFWATLFGHFWRDSQMIRSVKILDKDRACVRRMIDMTLKPFLVLEDTDDDEEIFDFEQDHYFVEAEYYSHLQDGAYIQSNEVCDTLHMSDGEEWSRSLQQRHLHERVEEVDVLDGFNKEGCQGEQIIVPTPWTDKKKLHGSASVRRRRASLSSSASEWTVLCAGKSKEKFTHQRHTPCAPEQSKTPVDVNSYPDTTAAQGELEEAFTFLNDYFLSESYFQDESVCEVRQQGSLSSSVEVVRAIIFMPPRHHVLLKFSMSQYSTVVRIVVDRYQLLGHLDRFFAASSNLGESMNFRRP